MTVRFKTTTTSLESTENALVSLESAIASLEDYDRAIDIAISVEAFDLKGVGEKVGRVLKELWDKITAMIKRFINWIRGTKSPEQTEKDNAAQKKAVSEIDPKLISAESKIEAVIVPNDLSSDEPLTPPPLSPQLKKDIPNILSLPNKGGDLYDLDAEGHGSLVKTMTFAEFKRWVFELTAKKNGNVLVTTTYFDNLIAVNKPHVKSWLMEFKRFYLLAAQLYGVGFSSNDTFGVGILANELIEAIPGLTDELTEIYNLMGKGGSSNDTSDRYNKIIERIESKYKEVVPEIVSEVGKHVKGNLHFNTWNYVGLDGFIRLAGHNVTSRETAKEMRTFDSTITIENLLRGKTYASFSGGFIKSRQVRQLNDILDKLALLDIGKIQSNSPDIPIELVKLVSKLTALGVRLIRLWVGYYELETEFMKSRNKLSSLSRDALEGFM